MEIILKINFIYQKFVHSASHEVFLFRWRFQWQDNLSKVVVNVIAILLPCVRSCDRKFKMEYSFLWTRLDVGMKDDKIIVAHKLKFVSGSIENIVGKGENAGYQHFLLFPLWF